MSKRTIGRNKAIRLAWEREQLLVSEGKGTRDWTKEQQQDILDPDKGKAYDRDGRAFEGQHMKSVRKYPEYQDNPDNIQFLTNSEHFEAHKGNWQNQCNWYYNPITKEYIDFAEDELPYCKIIELSDPIIAISNADSKKRTSKDKRNDYYNNYRKGSHPINEVQVKQGDESEYNLDKVSSEVRGKESVSKNNNIASNIIFTILNSIVNYMTFREENPIVSSFLETTVGFCKSVIVDSIINSNVKKHENIYNVSSNKSNTKETANVVQANDKVVEDSNNIPVVDLKKTIFGSANRKYTENDVPPGTQHYNTGNGRELRPRRGYHRTGKNNDNDI